MASKRWHGDAEIAAKLEQAKQLAAEGKTQSEIARILGISIMTYHRWRNARRGVVVTSASAAERPKPADGLSAVAELQLENSRLRRLVTDLLLERIELQEELGRQPTRGLKRETPLK